MVHHTLTVTILAVLLVGCGHSTDREMAKIRVDDFAYSRVDDELLVGMTLLNSGRQSLWFWGQGPNDPCQFYQKWEAG